MSTDDLSTRYVKFRCIKCSTEKEPIYVSGMLNVDDYIECNVCGSIELEEVVEDDEEMNMKADLRRKYEDF